MPKTRVIGGPPSRAAWVFVAEGADKGRDFKIRTRLTIGTDTRNVDLILNDTSVSAQHCRVKQEGNAFILYDLASTNGTHVNGKRVQRHILSDDDVIVVGHTKLVFKVTPL